MHCDKEQRPIFWLGYALREARDRRQADPGTECCAGRQRTVRARRSRSSDGLKQRDERAHTTRAADNEMYGAGLSPALCAGPFSTDCGCGLAIRETEANRPDTPRGVGNPGKRKYRRHIGNGSYEWWTGRKERRGVNGKVPYCGWTWRWRTMFPCIFPLSFFLVGNLVFHLSAGDINHSPPNPMYLMLIGHYVLDRLACCQWPLSLFRSA